MSFHQFVRHWPLPKNKHVISYNFFNVLRAFVAEIKWLLKVWDMFKNLQVYTLLHVKYTNFRAVSIVNCMWNVREIFNKYIHLFYECNSHDGKESNTVHKSAIYFDQSFVDFLLLVHRYHHKTPAFFSRRRANFLDNALNTYKNYIRIGWLVIIVSALRWVCFTRHYNLFESALLEIRIERWVSSFLIS